VTAAAVVVATTAACCLLLLLLMIFGWHPVTPSFFGFVFLRVVSVQSVDLRSMDARNLLERSEIRREGKRCRVDGSSGGRVDMIAPLRLCRRLEAKMDCDTVNLDVGRIGPICYGIL
jgi:hypothetical protein